MCLHFHPLLLCKYLELVHQVKQRCISLQSSSNGIYVCITYKFRERRCLHKTLLLLPSAISSCCMVPSGKEGGRCSCIQEVATFKSPVSAASYLHFISTISILVKIFKKLRVSMAEYLDGIAAYAALSCCCRWTYNQNTAPFVFIECMFCALLSFVLAKFKKDKIHSRLKRITYSTAPSLLGTGLHCPLFHLSHSFMSSKSEKPSASENLM